MSNSTTMDFLLMKISHMRDLQLFYAMSFFLIYLLTVMGNLVIAAVTTLDKSLHTPMYFFLRNLSILDSCYISVTVPKSCMNSLLGTRSISKAGCEAQVFLVVFFVYVEMMFLTMMAHDRFAAICRPLHYPVIMSPRLCVHSTLAALLSGLIYASLHTLNTFRLPFCQSHAVQQLFCDIPSLLKLSCSDTFSNQITVLMSGLVIGGGSFIYIIKSYIHIFSTVLKFPVGTDRKKAFSTCVPHILVVSVFLSSGFYVYLRPSAMSAGLMDMVLSVFYSVIPPLFNPIIYSLRNEQIKCAIQKLMTQMF
ncbi:LOW QUALITY PROTEIN: olfactory receptor 14C36-like [Fukomys damarensis]|uniref:LOW QUALITY PROTEIN: olfactory receptor 14C36-like n=1 Tax=Fukomys damarensis TaxID=885580 RepID=UPI00053F4B8B|nr:LOW QUALITY PROTEIN: olfactory receptor 14C36-like [Fukomys damarensis]